MERFVIHHDAPTKLGRYKQAVDAINEHFGQEFVDYCEGLAEAAKQAHMPARLQYHAVQCIMFAHGCRGLCVHALARHIAEIRRATGWENHQPFNPEAAAYIGRELLHAADLVAAQHPAIG